MGGGYIEALGLTDWWETTFTAEERQLASERFTSLGSSSGLTSGTCSTTTPAGVFVRQLAGWFRKGIPVEASIREHIEVKANELSSVAKNVGETRPPKGIFEGRHDTEYINEVKVLKREGRLEEAAALLRSLIDVVIAESAAVVLRSARHHRSEAGQLRRRSRRLRAVPRPPEPPSRPGGQARCPSDEGPRPTRLGVQVTARRAVIRSPWHFQAGHVAGGWLLGGVRRG